jgi:hypothetical protein
MLLGLDLDNAVPMFAVTASLAQSLFLKPTITLSTQTLLAAYPAA